MDGNPDIIFVFGWRPSKDSRKRRHGERVKVRKGRRFLCPVPFQSWLPPRSAVCFVFGQGKMDESTISNRSQIGSLFMYRPSRDRDH